jgi:hypothetical protein
MPHISSFATKIAETANALQFAHAVIDAITGETYEHAQLIRGPSADQWLYSTENEFGRLTKGVAPHMPSVYETMRYLFHHQLPPGRQATYACFVATERPHKAEARLVRLTVGGKLVHYPEKVSTPTADLSTVKLLLNSVISTTGAGFATLDLKDFYLGTLIAHKECMRIPLVTIPQSIIDQYTLSDKAHKGLVLVEISKGMYGLPQAGILAFNQLKNHLANHDYDPCTHTPGLWTHSTRDITFSLVVDDFGIKYTNRHDAIHLLTVLEELYTVTTDWTGSLYLAMTLNWDNIHSTVDISMPGNVAKALECFQHTPHRRAEHSPYAWSKPIYSTHPQLTSPVDDTSLLPQSALTRIQEITGTLLLYARAIDCTMLVALGTLASNQSKGTHATAQYLTQLLNNASAYLDATVRYTASDMYLHIHSDASYLSEAKARSRAGGTSTQNLTIHQLHPVPPPHLHHTTAPSTPSAPSCKMAWHLPQKQSSVPSSKMLVNVSLSASLSKKWDTRKPSHPSKPTMHAQLASPMKLLNNIAQNPSTCAFNRSATKSSKANL